MALNTLAVPATPAVTAPELLVLLAGAYDRPADFIRAGFVTALQASGRTLDLVLVETDLGAVCDGSLSARIEAEILVPARSAGYRRILTGGISIGGLAALMHLDRFPAGSAGLVLIAPYPGNRSITREIEQHGGVRTWPAAPAAAADTMNADTIHADTIHGDSIHDYAANDERCGWRALQRCAQRQGPPLWLGYGNADRFAGGHAMMAGALDPAHTVVVGGGHDWPTWLRLWQHYLAHG